MIRRLIILALVSSILPMSHVASCREVPRTVIGLYADSEEEQGPHHSWVHKYAEMPLNHLGLKIEYHNVNAPLPDLGKRPDVLGVISWFRDTDTILKSSELLQWAVKAITLRKKYVIIGGDGFTSDSDESPIRFSLINNFYSRLGIRYTGDWIIKSYRSTIDYSDPDMIGFEREYSLRKNEYPVIEVVKRDVTAHLKLRVHKGSYMTSALVVSSPRGGYISEGYACNTTSENDRSIQWFVNPFKFFKRTFATQALPKPDITTLAGRRIYFSHLDGDSWNSITLVDGYEKKRAICAQVLYDRVYTQYP